MTNDDVIKVTDYIRKMTESILNDTISNPTDKIASHLNKENKNTTIGFLNYPNTSVNNINNTISFNDKLQSLEED